jgi:uncharacterized protein (TIGR04255 family)
VSLLAAFKGIQMAKTAGTSGRKLSRAPLIYVLAQVRIGAILQLAERIPPIQEALRKNYPYYRAKEMHNLHLGMPGSASEALGLARVEHWEFADRDRTSGFTLQSNAITFHTTRYDTFEPFLDALRNGLEAIHKELNVGLTTRIGLRYVDLIVPEQEGAPTMYVSPGLAGFPVQGVAKTNSETVVITSVQTEIGQMVLRYMQSRSGAILPSDLDTLSLQLQKSVDPGMSTATLDIDHFREFDKTDFSVDHAVTWTDQLHATTSKAFWDTLTPYALEKWQETTPRCAI